MSSEEGIEAKTVDIGEARPAEADLLIIMIIWPIHMIIQFDICMLLPAHQLMIVHITNYNDE